MVFCTTSLFLGRIKMALWNPTSYSRSVNYLDIWRYITDCRKQSIRASPMQCCCVAKSIPKHLFFNFVIQFYVHFYTGSLYKKETKLFSNLLNCFRFVTLITLPDNQEQIEFELCFNFQISALSFSTAVIYFSIITCGKFLHRYHEATDFDVACRFRCFASVEPWFSMFFLFFFLSQTITAFSSSDDNESRWNVLRKNPFSRIYQCNMIEEYETIV